MISRGRCFRQLLIYEWYWIEARQFHRHMQTYGSWQCTIQRDLFGCCLLISCYKVLFVVVEWINLIMGHWCSSYASFGISCRFKNAFGVHRHYAWKRSSLSIEHCVLCISESVRISVLVNQMLITKCYCMPYIMKVFPSQIILKT